MRNKIFLIIIDVCFILCVSGITVFTYLTFRDDIKTDSIVFIMLVQNMTFVVLALIALIYIALSKKEQDAPDDISVPYVSKLLKLNEAGDIKSEYDLKNKKSLIIGQNEHEENELIYAVVGGSLKYEYAVLNLEKNYWYIEAISEIWGVGIRKEYDGLFRRLKNDKPCLIGKNDVIEIAGEKIIVR